MKQLQTFLQVKSSVEHARRLIVHSKSLYVRARVLTFITDSVQWSKRNPKGIWFKPKETFKYMHHDEDSDGAEVKFQLNEKEERYRLIKINILQSCWFRRQHLSGTAYYNMYSARHITTCITHGIFCISSGSNYICVEIQSRWIRGQTSHLNFTIQAQSVIDK